MQYLKNEGDTTVSKVLQMLYKDAISIFIHG